MLPNYVVRCLSFRDIVVLQTFLIGLFAPDTQFIDDKEARVQRRRCKELIFQFDGKDGQFTAFKTMMLLILRMRGVLDIGFGAPGGHPVVADAEL